MNSADSLIFITELQRSEPWGKYSLEFAGSPLISSNRCSPSRLLLSATLFFQACCIQDVEELCRDIAQNPKTRRPLCFEDQ